MTIPWESIPLEVWMNIFDRVQSLKQLAQCRLVCKRYKLESMMDSNDTRGKTDRTDGRWVDPAERSMFRFGLDEKSTDRYMNSLLQHLEKKPALAQLIKYVKLESDYCIKPRMDTRKSLLRMIINPNIEELDVSNASETDSKLLVDILETSGIKLDKVKTLRSPRSPSQASSDLRHLVRHSLESLAVDVTHSTNNHDYAALKYLKDYKSLKSFSLCIGPINPKTLEPILRQLLCVSELTLKGTFSAPHTEAALDQWLEQSVQKDDHVKKLDANLSSSQSDANSLMKYLAYKYPQLATLTFEVNPSYCKDFPNIFPYITQIPTVSIPCQLLDKADDLFTIGHGMKSAFNTISIFYYTEERTDTNMIMASRSKANNYSDFSVDLTPESSHECIRKLLSGVSAEGSNIADLSIDLVHGRESREYSYDDLDMDLYELLNMVPGIGKLEFSNASVEYNPEKGFPTLDNLHSLEFCRTEVDPKVISQIGQKAPNLKHLTLATCLVLVSFRLHHVALPTVSLQSLTFSMKGWKWDLPDSDDDSEDSDDDSDLNVYQPEMDKVADIDKALQQMQTAYLHIKINGATDQYLMLRSNTNQAVLLAKEEFDMNSRTETVFYIECESLSRLSVQLGSIHVVLQFTNGKQLDDEGETLTLSGSLKKERAYQNLETRYNALKQHMLTKMNVSSDEIQEIENQANTSLA